MRIKVLRWLCRSFRSEGSSLLCLSFLSRRPAPAVYIEYVHLRPRSEKLLNALAKALNFGAPELLENRRGHLHPNQLSRLAGQHVAESVLGVALSVLAPLLFRFVWAGTVEHRSLLKFAVTVLSNPPSFLSQMRFGIEEPFPLVIELGYFVFPLVLIHYMMRMPYKIFYDLISKKVRQCASVYGTTAR